MERALDKSFAGPDGSADLRAAHQAGDRLFTIGDMARAYKVTLRALRFYEDRGLIKPIRHGVSRFYDSAARARFETILRGKQLGFTLTQIFAMLPKDEKPEAAEALEAGRARLLAEALTVENKKPAPGCTPDCPDDGVAEVIYRVAPMSFLPRGEQNALCLQLEDETAAAPLSFTPPTFGGVEALNRWISELSQGRGDDGKALYERCASNCSPRYTFFIASEEAGYSVRAEVLCGLARDKSNDQYLISTALRRSCAVD